MLLISPRNVSVATLQSKQTCTHIRTQACCRRIGTKRVDLVVTRRRAFHRSWCSTEPVTCARCTNFRADYVGLHHCLILTAIDRLLDQAQHGRLEFQEGNSAQSSVNYLRVSSDKCPHASSIEVSFVIRYLAGSTAARLFDAAELTIYDPHIRGQVCDVRGHCSGGWRSWTAAYDGYSLWNFRRPS